MAVASAGPYASLHLAPDRCVCASNPQIMYELLPYVGLSYYWIDDRLRVGVPSRYVTSQLGQLNLASVQRRLIDY